MVSYEEISIKKIIVHILDTSMSIPVMSMDEMPTSIDINDFFAHHIARILDDDGMKSCVFEEEFNVFYGHLKEYQNQSIDFVAFSKQIAGQLFAIMSSNIAIPSADLAIVSYRYRSMDYLALLKLNYQSTFIHFTDYESDVNINTIITHRTTLPNYGQRISECALINLDDLSVDLLDKSYDINGEKKYYLTSLFLKCHTKPSSKEKLQAVKAATNKVAKKYYDQDPEMKAQITETLYKSLDEEGTLDLESFVSEAFLTNEFTSDLSVQEEAKEIFYETLEKKGITEPKISMTEKTISRSFEKQRIKTDEGIEIKIPMEFYNDSSKLEFITEQDGTISILLKGIQKIIS
ncbi:MAG: nucleoid-associated protein [Vallitaleaceae bacterium]|nr:nucleoid-associated protein [Vallitaleaceae bacterium]